MATAVAFLRAINVGGRFIKMAELAAHFESLGLADVSTYINSGNVLFSTRVRNLSQLAARIERDLEPLLGFKSEVFLRTPSEVHAIAATAQSHRSGVPESGEVNVAFLAAPLDSEQLSALQSLRTDLDEFAHNGREVYWLCKGNQMPESVTPEPATARLASMASKIAVHRPFGAAAPLPWCVGRLS